MSAQQSGDSEYSTSATSPTASQTKQKSPSTPATQSPAESSSLENPPSSTTTLNETASASAAAKASRKRTKTGCLTCRKRRIKCGEERPICANCVKSKRTCEGYNQRVVFKDGMNSLRAVTGIPGTSSIPIDRRYHPYPIQPAPPALQTLQPIAPAPPVPPQSQPYLREGQLEHSQPHLRGHTYDLHSALHSHHAVIDGRQQQPQQLSHQSNYYSFVPTNSDNYSLPSSTTAENQPAAPSPLYGGPAAHQSSSYKGTGTVNPCLPSQTSPPVDSCPFNPPLDTKYMISGSYSTSRHQGEGLEGLYRDNEIRRFPGSPNDEEVYYTG